MEALPEFELLRPATLADALAARLAHPRSQLLGGGTDLLVNVRRGIVAPPVLIDTTGVGELKGLAVGAATCAIGAGVTLAELAANPDLRRGFAAVAAAAGSVAGPTQRNMATVGGNLCLDTRCIFYNQSAWWRAANDHCLKTTGSICHVAPKSRGVCFATFSGDLAPALLVFDAEIEVASPAGRRSLPLAEFYIGRARQPQAGETAPEAAAGGDGKHFLALGAQEIVTGVRARNAGGLVSAYDKVRVRRSIEFPVAGVAVALKREGDILADLRVAVTGTNPRPVRLEGTAEFAGARLEQATLRRLDALMRDQIMSMKTTFTPGHYRRRVAGVLARRLVVRLFAEA
jgi:4-hydroxybenzoyl-CoA reductase subunit beta